MDVKSCGQMALYVVSRNILWKKNEQNKKQATINTTNSNVSLNSRAALLSLNSSFKLGRIRRSMVRHGKMEYGTAEEDPLVKS